MYLFNLPNIDYKTFDILLSSVHLIQIESFNIYNRCDGVIVRTSTLQSVDLGLIPRVKSYQRTLKNVFTASPLGTQHIRIV